MSVWVRNSKGRLETFETLFGSLFDTPTSSPTSSIMAEERVIPPEKGKLPPQTQPNPNNQSVKIVSKDNHEECKTGTILRSGKAIGEEDESGTPKVKEAEPCLIPTPFP
jgi:hypothetical protein